MKGLTAEPGSDRLDVSSSPWKNGEDEGRIEYPNGGSQRVSKPLDKEGLEGGDRFDARDDRAAKTMGETMLPNPDQEMENQTV